jgi:cyclohexanone monooxygenase
MADVVDEILAIDRDALRERYRAEKDKRLRADGNDQYQETSGSFAQFAVDHYVGEIVPREALSDEVVVAIIGGGFGGLMAGARLREAGVERLRIIERGGQFGGTWYWNRYPGAQCDVESYVYMPLLEELDVMPSEKYAHAPEILEHAQRIADHFDLADSALLQTGVEEMRWDDERQRWHISTDRGDEFTARFIVMATGPLNRPKLPGVPGISTFAGHSFHTSRWDFDYTGGDSSGGLDKLADKRIAIIGTGATSIQAVPYLAESAQHVYVFQRTPSSVDERGNSLTDPAWFKGQPAGWQKERMENFNAMLSIAPVDQDLVHDGWTKLIHEIRDAYMTGRSEEIGSTLEEVVESVNFKHMEELRARIDREVGDPAIAESLKPYYGLFCKRPTFNDEYLASFNRDNVTLVDTDGQGVEKITETGLVANGSSYEVDCIIYATGFEVGTGFERRSGCHVIGRDGRTLTDKWEGPGIRTLHGMHTHGYPNLFIMSQSQAGFTANYTHLLDEAAHHLSFIVAHMDKEGLATVEVTRGAEEAWAEEIIENARDGGGGIGGTDCTPGYYNNEGQDPGVGRYGVWYGKGSVAFFELTKQWREAGTFEGLTFAPPVS